MKSRPLQILHLRISALVVDVCLVDRTGFLVDLLGSEHQVGEVDQLVAPMEVEEGKLVAHERVEVDEPRARILVSRKVAEHTGIAVVAEE